jgi:outer membrane protein, multidrug efflux system
MGAFEMLRSIVGLALSVLASSLSAGCAPVGPNYARPPVPAQPAYRFVQEPSQAQSLADLPWWEVFDDTALQSLVWEAVANNLDVRIAAARVEEARARAGIARSFLYPQIDASVSSGLRVASSTAKDNGLGDNDDHTRQSGVIGVGLSWELDLFGRIRREHEAALAIVLATDQGRRGVLVTLVADVASNYFLLRELDQQLEIARATLRINEDTVTYFRNRLDGGVSNRLELDRIQALRAETAAAIPQLENDIAVAENGLSLLLGRPPSGINREGNPLDMLPPAVPVGLPASLLERRPDVIEAEQLLVAANADIGAARALFYPTISLTSFGGAVGADLSQFLGGTGAIWSISAGLLQPLYNAGRNKANLAAAQARFEQALAQYQKAALNGYREVADALVTIQKLQVVRTERQGGVTVLQDAADLARSRYDSGLASYIEILTADQDLFQQQLLLAQTHGAELRARAEIYRALGGGWQQP